MVRNLLVLIFMLVSLGLHAQLVSSNAHVFVTGTERIDFTGSVVVRNLSDQAVEVDVFRSRNNLPQGWLTAIGKGSNIQSPFKDAFTLSIPANGSARLAVQFSPKGGGTGTVELVLQAANDPSNQVVQKFTGSTRPSTLSKQIDNISVFPNPADSYFKISDQQNQVKKVQVYNIVGRMIGEYQVHHPGEEFDVTKFSRGIYLIRLLDAQDKILVTQRLNVIKP
ncbi:MAG: T9SS type A sorting domain-containing protein [Bacteroidota bacterium]